MIMTVKELRALIVEAARLSFIRVDRDRFFDKKYGDRLSARLLALSETLDTMSFDLDNPRLKIVADRVLAASNVGSVDGNRVNPKFRKRFEDAEQAYVEGMDALGPVKNDPEYDVEAWFADWEKYFMGKTLTDYVKSNEANNQ